MAVQQNGKALKYASEILKGKEEIVTLAIEQTAEAMSIINLECAYKSTTIIESIKALIKKSAANIKYLPPFILSNHNYILELYKVNKDIRKELENVKTGVDYNSVILNYLESQPGC